ncbi:SERTA domain-containing protein 3 [Lampris incognitus]|uniref:SERTA domain-containing protein 3 n=1 Tax=Lampris incognitus TaxID=2546036 RepID=UPI0024B58858|nr:SERTA domain-containing protein 3 [Lampris incognitus]
MMTRGQKRKLPAGDIEISDGNSAAWENQRQFVFYVSLNKYQRGQELPEPSLRRSVLIANTLRQMTLEHAPSVNTEVLPSSPNTASSLQMRQSVSPRMAEPYSQPTEMFPSNHSGVVNDSLAASNHQTVLSDCSSNRFQATYLSSASAFPLCMEEDDDGGDDNDERWGSISPDPDFSLSAAISSILTALDSTMEGSPGISLPQAAPRTPLRSLENLSGSEGDAAGAKPGVKGHWSSWECQEDCRGAESSLEGMRSSYLGNLAVDDLFQDIDTSLMEQDMAALEVRGGGAFSRGGSAEVQASPLLLFHLLHSASPPSCLSTIA